jgi:hypothetical protein
LARYNLDVDGYTVDKGRVARIWEEDDSVLNSDYLTRKADPFIAYSNRLSPSTCTWRKLKTGP